MIKRENLVIILVVVALFTTSQLTGKVDAREASRGILGRIFCVEGIDWLDVLYAGADSGLYKSMDAGGSWKKVDLPGGVLGVNDIAVQGENVFIATTGGTYIYSPDAPWRHLSGSKNIIGVAASFKKRLDKELLAWSPENVFLIKEESWKDLGPGLLMEPIAGVVLSDGTILVCSGQNVYHSSNEGEVWNKITLLRGHDGEEEGSEIYDSLKTEEELSVIRNIVSFSPEGAAVGTRRGIFIIDKKNSSKRRIDTTGFPAAHLRYVTQAGGKLFAATDKKVFLYSDKTKSWQGFFDKTLPGDISFLKGHIDAKGRRWLWIVGGRHLYKQSIDSLESAEGLQGEGKGLGPTILDVHEMAVEYAEVSPEKIKRWRRGAKWKAILPRVSLNFAESIDDNIEIYKNSTTSYVVSGPRERDNDWGVDLTWDLSDLVWNDSQTSIDVRSKLMVQLRDDILEEVTRLYFERKRLLSEFEERCALDNEEVHEKQLRIEELTAYIDALTGGKFSEAIEGRIAE